MVIEHERLVWRRGDADLGARPARDGLVKPDLLDESRMLHETQQRGLRGYQPSAHLLLRQPVQAAVERFAVLVEECLELGPGWLIDEVLGERRRQGRHVRSMPRPSPKSN